jgi:hypothetical protein
MKYLALTCLLLATAAWTGCESSESAAKNNGGDSDSDSDSDSDTDTDSDSDTDSDTDTDTNSDSDTICDEQNFQIELAPVRLMILQDMSFSMADPEVANPTNWSHAKPALETLLNEWMGEQIEFGFDIFPDGSNGPLQGCLVDDPVQIDCGPGNETAIISYINDNTPNGNSTPLYCGMENFLDPTYAPTFVAPEAASYQLIVSDGADLCGEGCCTGIFNPACIATEDEFIALTQDLLAADIMTFVIGFGSGVDEGQLNAIAANGGTDFTDYLYAEDQASLEDALDAIAAAVVSCVYNIDEPEASADPDNVNFFFDDEIVYYDEDCAVGEGWTWVDEDHTQVEFCDEACQQLQDGLVTEISAVFGCPTEIIE